MHLALEMMNVCKELMIVDEILDISKTPRPVLGTQESLNNCSGWVLLLLVCILVLSRDIMRWVGFIAN